MLKLYLKIMQSVSELNFQKVDVARLSFLCCFLCCALMVYGQSAPTYNTARSGEVFQIFQFPRNQMPRIDGDKSDWEIVPEDYTYGTDHLIAQVFFTCVIRKPIHLFND